MRAAIGPRSWWPASRESRRRLPPPLRSLPTRSILVTRLSAVTAALSACAYAGCSSTGTKEPSERLDTQSAVHADQQPESVRVQTLLDARSKAADVRHSFITKFGEVVDCIDFFAQPGVKRPAALGHPITKPPPPAIDDATRASLPDDFFNGKPDGNGAPRACPADSVPMLRITAANIQAAGGADGFIRAHSHKALPKNTAPLPVQPGGLDPGEPTYGHVVETFNNTDADGDALPISLGGATMNVWQPTVPLVALDHSLGQVWMYGIKSQRRMLDGQKNADTTILVLSSTVNDKRSEWVLRQSSLQDQVRWHGRGGHDCQLRRRNEPPQQGKLPGHLDTRP
jgi:hypothetical protein